MCEMCWDVLGVVDVLGCVGMCWDVLRCVEMC